MYRTVMHEGRGEYEEKRSTFYGVCLPVKSENEALALIAAEKKRYPDARHHVYAYLLSDSNTTRYSDDREPQGTAGIPILDMLRKEGLTDVCCVVTRYFGGTLLGTGGLVRAYTAAAKAAMLSACPARGEETAVLTLSLSYAENTKITPLLEKHGVRVTDTVYSDNVTLSMEIPKERYNAFVAAVAEWSCARLSPVLTDTVFLLVPERGNE